MDMTAIHQLRGAISSFRTGADRLLDARGPVQHAGPSPYSLLTKAGVDITRATTVLAPPGSDSFLQLVAADIRAAVQRVTIDPATSRATDVSAAISSVSEGTRLLEGRLGQALGGLPATPPPLVLRSAIR